MLALSKKSSASVANVLAPIGEVLVPIGEVLAPIGTTPTPISNTSSYTEVEFKATMSSFYRVLMKLKKKALSFFL